MSSIIMRLDQNASQFPKRADLPEIPGAPKDAAWFWGEDDEVSLALIYDVLMSLAWKIKSSDFRANCSSSSDCQIGTYSTFEVCFFRRCSHLTCSLPLNVPGPAMFGRENFAHTVKKLAPGAYDEVFTCNPQSGTQWDGFRHVRFCEEVPS
jgi:hypothetical protein